MKKFENDYDLIKGVLNFEKRFKDSPDSILQAVVHDSIYRLIRDIPEMYLKQMFNTDYKRLDMKKVLV